MAYDTKLIVKLIAQGIAKCDTVKEAYRYVKNAASVEGMELPTYEEMKEELEKE